MWRELLDYGRRLFSLQGRVAQHDEKLKELRKDLDALTDLVREYRHEQLRDQAVAEKNRENLVLRLENAMLRMERGLPPGPPAIDDK